MVAGTDYSNTPLLILFLGEDVDASRRVCDQVLAERQVQVGGSIGKKLSLREDDVLVPVDLGETCRDREVVSVVRPVLVEIGRVLDGVFVDGNAGLASALRAKPIGRSSGPAARQRMLVDHAVVVRSRAVADVANEQDATAGLEQRMVDEAGRQVSVAAMAIP